MSCPAGVPGGNPPTIRWTRVIWGLGMVVFLDDSTIAHRETKRYRQGTAIRAPAWQNEGARTAASAEERLPCEILDFRPALGALVKNPSRFLSLAREIPASRCRSWSPARRVFAQQAHLAGVVIDSGCALDYSL